MPSVYHPSSLIHTVNMLTIKLLKKTYGKSTGIEKYKKSEDKNALGEKKIFVKIAKIHMIN